MLQMDRASRSLTTGGAVTVSGALSKGSGTFDIKHPVKEGWRLRHSFVESPNRGDNIYRFCVTTSEGSAEIELPEYWHALNENPQIWVNQVDGFGRGFGKVEGQKLVVKTDVDGEFNILLIGTRHDEAAKSGWDPLGLEYESSKNPALLDQKEAEEV